MEKIYFFTKKSNIISSCIENESIQFPKNGEEAWINQTYFLLSKENHEFDISITNSIPERGIIVFHAGSFYNELKPTKDQFFICVAADYGRHRYAQIHIFQNINQTQIKSSLRLIFDKLFYFTDNIFVPHWMQPNIIPRRKTSRKLRRIGYFGLRQNIELNLIDLLNDFSKKYDLDFEIVDDYRKWNDYSNFDLIVSIRGFRNNKYWNKPFSKLINSIIAGVPVISGNESSARYFKDHYFHYLPIVNNERELFHEIVSLMENYDKYLLIVEEYSSSLRETYPNDVENKWKNCLNSSVILFDKWKRASSFEKELFFRSRDV